MSCYPQRREQLVAVSDEEICQHAPSRRDRIAFLFQALFMSMRHKFLHMHGQGGAAWTLNACAKQ